MIKLRRCCRRRILPYILLINFLVCLCYLMPLKIVVSPKALDMSEEDMATQAILKALGPKGSNASSLVLPNENTVIIQPSSKVCENEGREVYVLFVIISSPGNFEARNAIRSNIKEGVKRFNMPQVAASTRGRSDVIFFSGVATDLSIQDKLEEEARREGDVIIDNVVDAYLNLTVKVLRMFKWIQSNCSHLKFLVKMDDDVHLNLLKLFKFLDNISSGDPVEASLLIAGHYYTNKEPVRSLETYGKWFAPQEVWRSSYYPDFIGGPAYILGFQALENIYQKSLDTELFHLEDVFVTGVVANAGLKMKFTAIPRVVVDWPTMATLTHTSCFVQGQFLVHSVNPGSLKCWKIFNSENFVCDHWPLAISTLFC